MAALKKVNVANVELWDATVGAIAWDEERRLGSFEYDEAFRRSGLEVSPLTMPLDRAGVFAFPGLNRETFQGLPGLLADALPDRFGNALINLWLRRHGRSPQDFSPVERLCYMGSRGMGALMFRPALARPQRAALPLEVEELVELANEILRSRGELSTDLSRNRAEALETIIRVGTSAGGARAKAVIALNPETGEVRSGQLDIPEGFEPWLLKFDGVEDDHLSDPKGFGLVEYAYYRMATKAGIEMAPCRLLREGNRAHFLTRRFDRGPNGERIHMQSLCGLAHYDFNMAGAYGYEDAFATARRLRLGHEAIRQLYRRMVFNVIARNQDDHTRNISFLMDREGRWYLAPAYDMVWSYNPRGTWTSRHQMRVNGKQDSFDREDLLAAARNAGVKDAEEIIHEVATAVATWMEFAAESGVRDELAAEIARSHRLGLEPGVRVVKV